MSGWTRGSLFAALNAAGLASVVGWVLVLSASPALADPDPAPGDPGVVAPPADPPAPPPDAVARRRLPPYPLAAPAAAQPAGAAAAAGLPPARSPPRARPPGRTRRRSPARRRSGRRSFVPNSGSTVGVGQPIIINFPGTVDDAGAAIGAVHVSSVPPVPGKFYWMTPTQLRWRPIELLARAYRGDRRRRRHRVHLPDR